MKKKRKKRAPPRGRPGPRPPRRNLPEEEVQEEYIQPGFHIPPISEGYTEDAPTQYVREGDLPVFEPIIEESLEPEPWIRKSNRPVFDVETKWDRLMSGRKLTVRERYEQMFGEKLQVNDRAELKEVVKKTKEEKKIEELSRRKEEMEEFIEFKKIVDKLLEKLNDDDIDQFVNSENFKFYEKVMEENETEEAERIKFVKIIDDMLEKLPEDVINEFADSPEFSCYEKIAMLGKGD